jgi:S-(hydroxymethyl)glutathione dehydrogenase/alcohol dehydrogenase
VVGCAVATGVGAALNTARLGPGQSAAVVGCGGVGISVVQGCAAMSAEPLIAIDANPEKLALASRLGATHTVDASTVDAVEAVREITGGGVDYAFEAIGLKATIEEAILMLGVAGTAVLVGMPPDGVTAEIDPMTITSFEQRILGCIYGSCNPPVDFPRILGLHRRGRLDLDSIVTRRIPLEQVNEAFTAMAAGEGVRTVVVYE